MSEFKRFPDRAKMPELLRYLPDKEEEGVKARKLPMENTVKVLVDSRIRRAQREDKSNAR